MHPFRVAILIFFVGASLVNIFVAKLHHDEIGPAPVLQPHGLFDSYPTPTPSENVPLQKPVIDKALAAEAVIVTVTGIAWFLVPAKTKQP